MFSFSQLLTRTKAADFFAWALQAFEAVGVNVTSWYVGDVPRELTRLVGEKLEMLDAVVYEYALAASLETATGHALTLRARELYAVERGPGRAAVTDVELQLTKPGIVICETGDALLTNGVVTYRNAVPFTLAGSGATATVPFVCDEASSAGTLAGNDGLTLVTPLSDVAVVSNTAAVGLDEQSDASLREACRLSLATRSPNGMANAYELTALNWDGPVSVLKAKASSTVPGEVTVYVHGATPLDSGQRGLLRLYLTERCLPLGFDLAVQNVNTVALNVTATLGVKSGSTLWSTGEIAARVEAAIREYLDTLPIGGVVQPSHVDGLIYGALPPGSLSTLSRTLPSAAVGDATSLVIAGSFSLTVSFVA